MKDKVCFHWASSRTTPTVKPSLRWQPRWSSVCKTTNMSHQPSDVEISLPPFRCMYTYIFSVGACTSTHIHDSLCSLLDHKFMDQHPRRQTSLHTYIIHYLLTGLSMTYEQIVLQSLKKCRLRLTLVTCNPVRLAGVLRPCSCLKCRSQKALFHSSPFQIKLIRDLNVCNYRRKDNRGQMLIVFGDFCREMFWHRLKCLLIKKEVRHKKYCTACKCNQTLTILFGVFYAQMCLAHPDRYLHEPRNVIEA